MSEIGSGNNSSYPGALDTNAIPEVNSPAAGKTKARKEVVEDLTHAVIMIETELGIDPAGSLTDVKTFLQTQHQTDGTHKTTHGPHVWIDAADYDTFTDAINAAVGKTLVISSSINLTLAEAAGGAVVIPATVLGVFPMAPGVINKNTATSLTINGPVVGNPMHQWLSGFAAGEVTFRGGNIYPQWFGASNTASATTNKTALRHACRSVGIFDATKPVKVILTPDLDLEIDDTIYIRKGDSIACLGGPGSYGRIKGTVNSKPLIMLGYGLVSGVETLDSGSDPPPCVYGLRIENAGTNGIDVQGDIPEFFIQNNRFGGNISLQIGTTTNGSGKGAIVTHNVFDTGGIGIRVQRQAVDSTNTGFDLITDNIFFDRGTAVQIDGSNQVKVNDNHFIAIIGPSIHFSGSNYHVEVKDNLFDYSSSMRAWDSVPSPYYFDDSAVLENCDLSGNIHEFDTGSGASSGQCYAFHANAAKLKNVDLSRNSYYKLKNRTISIPLNAGTYVFMNDCKWQGGSGSSSQPIKSLSKIEAKNNKFIDIPDLSGLSANERACILISGTGASGSRIEENESTDANNYCASFLSSVANCISIGNRSGKTYNDVYFDAEQSNFSKDERIFSPGMAPKITSGEVTTQTTDATVTLLWQGGLGDNTVLSIKAHVIGIQSTGVNRASYIKAATIYRAGGGATIQGTVTTIHSQESNGAWDCDIVVSSNAVQLKVTGAAATTINWKGFIEVIPL